ncbi:MAG: MGMT family protein [Thermomicrobiales bacterium]
MRGPTDPIEEPTPAFVDAVLAMVATIPAAKVMTYGDIAGHLTAMPDLEGATGSYGARLVGQVMAHHGHASAWWKVIRSTGQPPKGYEARARVFYEAEGTPLTGSGDGYRVDLKRARYDPERPDEPAQSALF